MEMNIDSICIKKRLPIILDALVGGAYHSVEVRGACTVKLYRRGWWLWVQITFQKEGSCGVLWRQGESFKKSACKLCSLACVFEVEKVEIVRAKRIQKCDRT